MNNEEITTPTNNSTKKSGSWDWIWPSIVGVVIVKLFGLVGGLVTIGAYYWLKPKVGIWGAVAISAGLGVVSAVGLSAMLGKAVSTSPVALPTASTQAANSKPSTPADSKNFNCSTSAFADLVPECPQFKKSEPATLPKLDCEETGEPAIVVDGRTLKPVKCK